MADGFDINDPASDIVGYDEQLMGKFSNKDGTFDLSSFLTTPPANIVAGKSEERFQAEQAEQATLPDPGAQATQDILKSQQPYAQDLLEMQKPAPVAEGERPFPGMGQFQMSWGRQFSKGLYRGVGNVVESLGDAIVFAQSAVAPNSLKATAIKPAEWLREKGEAIRDKNQVYIPKELEEFEWKHLLNPEFWSSKVSEQLPFVFSMFVPYTAGATLVPRAVLAAGRLAGAGTKAARVLGKTKQVVDKGSGIAGKLFRQVEGKGGKAIGKLQLNPTVQSITSFAGGGMFANMSEGSMVAGDAIQRAIADGMDPKKAAYVGRHVFADNLKWMGIDAVSYGIIFGGLGRSTLRGVTTQSRKLKSGGAPMGLPQQEFKTFGQKMKSMVGSGILFGGVEGTIEQFQEVYQEWITLKNTAEANNELPPYENFMDFFNSPEMKETRGISFATGFLMGSVTNSVNQQSERDRILANKEELLNYNINISDQEGFIMQRQLISDVLKESVEHGSPGYSRTMLDDMLSENRINEQEHKVYNDILTEYETQWDNVEMRDRLSDSGHRILFNINTKIADLKQETEDVNEKFNQESKEINNSIKKSPSQKKQAIEILKQQRDDKLKTINDNIEKLETDKENLILATLQKEEGGKGLTKKEFQEYTVEGEKQKPKVVEQVKTFGERAVDVAKGAAKTVVGAAAKVRQVVTGEQEVEVVEKEKQEVTPENERLKSLEETLNEKQKETVALMREKGTSKEGIDSYIKNKAQENAKGNKLTQKYKAEDILANPQNYSEALVVNAWRHLRGKGGPIDSGGAEQYTKSLLEEIKKDIAEGVSMDSAKYDKAGRRGIREAYEAVQDLLGKKETKKEPKAEKARLVETPAEKASRLAKIAKEAAVVAGTKAAKKAKEVAKKTKEKAKEVKKKISDYFKDLKDDKGPERLSKKMDTSKLEAEDVIPIEEIIIDPITGKEEVKKVKVNEESTKNPNDDINRFNNHEGYNYAAIQLLKQGFRKRFKSKNAIIVDNLVSEYGVDVAAKAIGTTAFVKYEQGKPKFMQNKLLHEVTHMWYELNSTQTEVKELVKLLQDSPLYTAIEKLYPEQILYRQVKKGRPKYFTAAKLIDSLIVETDEYIQSTYTKEMADKLIQLKKAINLSVDKNKSKQAIEPLITDVMAQLEKEGFVKKAPKEKQHHINEEVFVTHLEMAGSDRFQFNFEEKNRDLNVKKSEGLIRRFYGRVSRMFGKKESEDLSRSQLKDGEKLEMDKLEDAIFSKLKTDKEVTPITNSSIKYSKKRGTMDRGKRRDVVNRATEDGQVLSYLRGKKKIKRADLQQEVNNVLEIMYRNTVAKIYGDLSNGATEKINNTEYILKGGKQLHKDLKVAAALLVSKKLDPNEKKTTMFIFDKRIEKYEGESSFSRELDIYLREEEYKYEEEDITRGAMLSNFPVDYWKHADNQEHYDENYEGVGFLGNKDGDVLSSTGSQLMDAWKQENWTKEKLVSKNSLRSMLFSLSQRSKNKFSFVNSIMDVLSTAPEKFDFLDQKSQLKDFVNFLENKFGKEESLSVLSDIFMDFQDLTYESIEKVGFSKGDNVKGKNFVFDSVKDSGEYNIVNQKLSLMSALNETGVKNSIVNAFNRLKELNKAKDSPEVGLEKNIITNQLVQILFGSSSPNEYLDYRSVLHGRYLIKGKYISAAEFLIQYGNEIIKDGSIDNTSPIVKSFLTQAVVHSRAKNGIVQVLNVNGKRTRILDYKGPTHHKIDSLLQRSRSDKERKIIAKEYNVNEDEITEGNLYAHMVLQGKRPYLGFLSGVFHFGNNKGIATSQMSAREFSLIQFAQFIQSANEGGKSLYRFLFNQNSSSKRQYQTDGLIYRGGVLQQKLKYLSKYNGLRYNNGKGDFVLPFKIVKKKGKYTIEGRNGESVSQLIKEQSVLIKNSGALIDGNDMFKGMFKVSIKKGIDQRNKGARIGRNWTKQYDVEFTKQGKDMLALWMVNDMINKFEAQEFFIGKHEKFKNENEMIKRGKHGFSRARSLNPDTKIATIVIPDVYKKGDDYRYVKNDQEQKQAEDDGYILVTDSDTYHLEEDGLALEEDFGDLRKIGKGHKPQIFGTDNRSSEERNDNIKDDVFLAKVVSAPLSDSKVAKDPHRKRIREVLEHLKTLAPEGTRIYAVSRSGAKLGSDSRMVDITMTDEQAGDRFKEIHFVKEEFRGDDPKNFGIVNELDQSTKGRNGTPRTNAHMPSQIIGHLDSLSTEENNLEVQKAKNSIYRVLDMQEKEATKEIQAVLDKEVLTPEDIRRLKRFVFGERTKAFMDKISMGIEDKSIFLPAAQEKITELLSSVIAKSRHKLMTRGTIGLSESEGMSGLKSNIIKTISREDAIKLGIPEEFVGREIVVHEIVLPQWMKSEFGLSEGDLIPSTSRIPGDRKMNSQAFIIKGFNDNTGNMVQIPAEVQEIWGSDNDGDAPFINVPYVRRTKLSEKQKAVNEALWRIAMIIGDTNRADERNAIMSFDEEAASATSAADNIHGALERKRNSQMTPLGAYEAFKNNLSSGNLIGPAAILNLVQVVLRANGVKLSTPITINGVTVDRFSNDSLETVMGLSKMLNMKLDQPTKQLLAGLGITKNTANAAMVLRGLGFSLNDIAIILRSEGAVQYDLAQGEFQLSAEDKGKVPPAMVAYYNLMTDLEKSIYHKSKLPKSGKFIESSNPIKDSIFGWYQKIEKGEITKEDISIVLEDLNSKDPKVKREANLKAITLLHYADIIADIIYSYNNQTNYHKSGNAPSSVIQIKSKREEFENSMKNRPVLDDGRVYDENGNKTKKGSLDKSIQLVHSNKTLSAIEKALSKVSLAGTKSAQKLFSRLDEVTGSAYDINRVNDRNGLIQKYIAKKIEKSIPVLGGTYKNIKGSPVNLQEAKESVLSFLLSNKDSRNKFSPFLDLILFDTTKGDLKIWANGTKNYVESQRQEIEKAFLSMPLDVQKAFIQVDFFSNGFQSGSIVSLMPEVYWFTRKDKLGINDILQDIFTQEHDGKIDPNNEEMIEEIIVENPEILHTFYENSFEKRGNIFILNDPKNADLKTKYIKVGQRIDGEFTFSILKRIGDENKWERISGDFDLKAPEIKEVPKGKTMESLDRAINRMNQSKKPPEKLSKKGPENTDKQDNHHQDSENISEMTESEFAASIGYNYEEIQKPENAELYKYIRERYGKYRRDLRLARGFIRDHVNNKEIRNERTWSFEKLNKTFVKFSRLENEAAKPAMDAIALELAMRAGKEQNDTINNKRGFKWDDKNDLGALQAWLLSNNIPSKRPEIQRLVNLMEQEYRKFVREYTTEKNNLQKVHRQLINEKMKNKSIVGRLKLRMNSTAWNDYVFGNIFTEDKYTDIDGVLRVNLRLKTINEFNASAPTVAEKAYYSFYRATTNKYFTRYAQMEGVNFSENYIPHVGMDNFETFSATGLYGLWNNLTGKVSNLDHIRVKGTMVVDGKTQTRILPLGQWKDIYLAGPITLPGGKKIFEIEKLKRRAQQLKKEGKHDDGTIINITMREAGELNNDGVFTRFVKGRPTDASKFATRNLTQALDTYMRATIFVYGGNEFMGFKQMMPLVQGIISLNKKLGNVNAAKYVERVWRDGFLRGKKQVWISKEVDLVVDTFVKWTLYVYLGMSIPAGIVNATMGKYNNIRSQGWRQWARGEARSWNPKTFRKTWKIIKNHYQWEDQVYDLVDFNPKSVMDTIIFAPLNFSEKWIQGVSFIGMMSEAEYNAYDDNGNIINQSNALSEEEILKRTDKIRRNQGRGYSRIDQRMLSMYSFGRAILQFKRWLPTMAVERFGQEDINRFGEQEVGSWNQFGKFSYNIVKRLASGEISLTTFKEEYRKMSPEQQNAVNTAMRGFGLLLILTGIMMFADDEDDKRRGPIAKIANRVRTDATIFFRPDSYAFTITPASFNTAQGGLEFLKSFATQERSQSTTRFREKGEKKWKGDLRKITPLQRALYRQS